MLCLVSNRLFVVLVFEAPDFKIADEVAGPPRGFSLLTSGSPASTGGRVLADASDEVQTLPVSVMKRTKVRGNRLRVLANDAFMASLARGTGIVETGGDRG